MLESAKRLMNPLALSEYEKAIHALIEIGFIDYLKERAVPVINGLGENTQGLATQAARSAGYFEAITDLINFKKQHTTLTAASELPVDYGGFAAAQKAGYLSPQEIEKLKREYLQKEYKL